MLLRPGQRPPRITETALLTAVVLHDAIAEVLGSRAGGLMLKWPNDVLLDHGKLAGILIEASLGASPFLIVGVGVNLREAPVLSERMTSVVAADGSVAPEPFAIGVLARLETTLGALDAAGFAPVRRAWLQAAHPIGTELHVSLPNGTAVEGSFAGLAEDGAMLIRCRDGLETIRTGDVLLA